METQYPARINDFAVKFWRYNVTDLARIGIPALAGGVAMGLPGAAIGGAAGLGYAEATPNGKKLDQLASDYVGSKLEGRSLDVSAELEHKVLVLDDGTVLGFVEVDSVDLDMGSETEWQVNVGALADLYKGLEIPIELHSRKRSVDLSEYQCNQNESVATDHFVVVNQYLDTESLLPWKSGEARSQEERIEDVKSTCRQVRDALNAGDLSADIVTGDHLEEFVNRFSYPELSFDSRRYRTGTGEKPFRRLIYIKEFPEQLDAGVLSNVLNVDAPGFVDVVQSVNQVGDKERKKLGRLVGRLQAEQAATPSALRSTDINRKIRDAEDLIDVEGGGERLVNHAAYIIARGSSWTETQETFDQVKRLLRRYGIEHGEPWLKTPHSVKMDSPMQRGQLNQEMIMPSQSAAASFAFSTHDKIEEGGVVYGIDSRNGMPVILDRYSWEAGDVVRMGKKGSGKSYSAKLSLVRALNQYEDLSIYILDPKQEYGVIGDIAGGKRVLLDDVDLDAIDVSGSDVVRYTVADRSRDNTRLLTEAMQHIYEVVSQDTSKKIVLVDETWHLLNDPEGVKVVGKLVREGRDVNACLELVTQNTTDYLRSQEGEDILKNVNCHIFFKHNEVANSVSDVFNLSQQEALELRKLGTGSDLPFSEAIIKGPVNTKLRIKSMPGEHALINSGGK
jgi:hypothetical protein